MIRCRKKVSLRNTSISIGRLGRQYIVRAASAFSGGDGSESAPYEISSAEELQYLANLLAEDALSDYRGKHYILTAEYQP